MPRRAGASVAVMSEIETPALPARAVQPERGLRGGTQERAQEGPDPHGPARLADGGLQPGADLGEHAGHLVRALGQQPSLGGQAKAAADRLDQGDAELALGRPDLDVTLVEPLLRRTTFLTEVVEVAPSTAEVARTVTAVEQL